MFWSAIILEMLVVWVPQLWKRRVYAISIILVLLGFWVGTVITQDPSKLLLLITAVVAFRAMNLLKATNSSIHPKYLRNVVRRTSSVLITLSVVLLGINALVQLQYLSDLLLPWGLLQFVIAALLLAVTSKNLQKTRHHNSHHYYSDKELPTVTVAIPARNETSDLASCLRTVLGSDYPKLEVLVLDDCSQDRTAEVIKDFAHDGVRFISGKPPKDRWLAKNQAYEELTHHASGEIILFCGVDVRFGPQAIRSLVTSMKTKDRKMMSVMPFRVGGGVNTSLIQPLRYWWEIALPRRAFNRPPVLSTCWLIDRRSLLGLGAFAGVSHNIIPERYFARELVKKDSYAFIRSDERLDIRTVKPIEEQIATAIRTRYPQLKKRPENVLFVTFLELAFIGAPFIFAITVFWTGLTPVSLLGLLSLGLLTVTHYLIMSASNPMHSIIALFNIPFALVTEVVLTVASMVRYEFGTVNWKGRNVCIPTMHVVKHLPKVK